MTSLTRFFKSMLFAKFIRPVLPSVGGFVSIRSPTMNLKNEVKTTQSIISALSYPSPVRIFRLVEKIGIRDFLAFGDLQ